MKKEAISRANSSRISRAEGGEKVRDLDQLGLPEFELLNERARELFRRVTGSPTAVVDDCWANVSRDGEYALPHSHKRSTASIVYALDPGEVEGREVDPMNGALYFCDPRLTRCCPGKASHVGGAFRPTEIDPALMIIFPSHITHAVTPYYGTRPRISVAWNLNAEAVPGTVRHDGRMT